MPGSMGLVATPYGLVGYSRDPKTEECRYFRIEDWRTPSVVRAPLFNCRHGPATGQGGAQFDIKVEGYDAGRDLLFTCTMAHPGQPIFQARQAANGRVRWNVTSADVGDPVTTLPVGAEGNRVHWACSGAAFDLERQEAVVPFNGNQNIIAAVSLRTGKVLWNTSVIHALRPIRTTVPVPEKGFTIEFQPVSATLTPDGIVVTGQATSSQGQEAAVVWLDRGGRIMGGQLAQDPSQAGTKAAERTATKASRIPSGSEWATAHGAVSSLFLGSDLVTIDPRFPASQRQPLEVLDSLNAFGFVPAPKQGEQTLLLPLRHTVVAIDRRAPSSGVQWREKDWEISDTILVPPHEGFVLAGQKRGSENLSMLFRVDFSTGTTIQRIPLPLQPTFVVADYANLCAASHPGASELDEQRRRICEGQGFRYERWFAHLLPLPRNEGLLVWDNQGNGAFLSRADPKLLPRLELTQPYPARGEEVRIRPAAAPGLTVDHFLVHWGDGSAVASIEPGDVATKRFEADGDYVLRVTAVFADNRTGTDEAIVHVGGTPPTRLTLMETAFSPQFQEVTFFVFGLLVTLSGALFALLSGKKRRSRLGRYLRELGAIRKRGAGDPAGAVRALTAFRRRILGDLSAGRIPDSQFSVLDLRMARLLHALVPTVLAPIGDRISPHFARVLAAALEDGLIHEIESRTVLSALKAERRLTATERARLADIVAR